MKLLFTKSIPPNPAPSKIIPIISETLYIYLIGFHPVVILAQKYRKLRLTVWNV